jgi:DNA-binding GntR family transcriptional regulator
MASFVDTRLRESIALAIRSLDYRQTVDITVSEHEAIYQGILDRSPAKAAESMRLHLTNASRRLGL